MAVIYSDEEEIVDELMPHPPAIRIIGTGGAGNNTLDSLHALGVHGAEIIAANTDAQDLLTTTADRKILLGRELTRGLGAGNNPDIGEKAAFESRETIKEVVGGCDAVFLTCGLGGGTGTGSAPVIAELCRNMGVLTIAIVSLPFAMEGKLRQENAFGGLRKLRQHTDSLIIIRNDKLLDLAPNLPLIDAFKLADEVLANAIKGIAEMVTKPGLVNMDFADLRAVTKDSGIGMIGVGQSDNQNRAEEAVKKAMSNPLLDCNVHGAMGALVNIIAGKDFRLEEANKIVGYVNDLLDPAARIVWGAQIDPSLGNTVKVLVITTGLKSVATVESLAHDGYVETNDLLNELL